MCTCCLEKYTYCLQLHLYFPVIAQGILDAAGVPPMPIPLRTLMEQCSTKGVHMPPPPANAVHLIIVLFSQGILDAAGIPPMPMPLRTLMEQCSANAKGSRASAQPTARDLTSHMPPDQRAPAMARIRCVGMWVHIMNVCQACEHACMSKPACMCASL